jgi:uncharacterized protein (TIGR02466 family)
MSNVTPISLFPIDVYKIKVTEHEKIKKYLMDHVHPHFVKHGANDRIQNTLTDYGFTADAAYCHWPFLLDLYKPDIMKILTSIGFNFKKHPWQVKMKGWYNMCTSNTATFVHDHTGGPTTIQFSAVHYVKLGDDNNATVFKNPNGKNIKATTPTKNFDYLPDYFINFQRMPEVEEGDLILFPSWLDHYVPNYNAGNLRITTALNIMMRVDDGDGN